MNLLCVIPYHAGDIDSATRLIRWIASLGSCKPHACLLIADDAVPKSNRTELKELATPIFASAATIPVSVPKVGFAPNHMFMLAAQQIMFSYRWPWLWLEPDAIPLKSHWLSKIADAYEASPKRFLGPIVDGKQPGLPERHLAGVSVYPPDAFSIYDKFTSIKTENVAWDMEAANDVVPRAQHTKLIQHFWGKRDLSPTFVADNSTARADNALPLSFLSPEAVVFHRCKDGSLIRLLQERMATPEKQPDPPKPAKTPRKTESPAILTDAI